MARELDAYADLMAEQIAVLGGGARGVDKQLWVLEAHLNR
jgi:hypothetical protein